jgi:hypothetical protein
MIVNKAEEEAIIFPKNLPSGYEWDYGLLEAGKANPEFYCEGYGHTHVSTLKDLLNGNEIYFYCDGEMRINYLDTNVRDCSRLLDIGIKNDSDIERAQFDQNYDFINNPWFDCYLVKPGDSEPEWLDIVHFDIINEGIPSAIFVLEELRNKNKD